MSKGAELLKMSEESGGAHVGTIGALHSKWCQVQVLYSRSALTNQVAIARVSAKINSNITFGLRASTCNRNLQRSSRTVRAYAYDA